MIRITGGVSDLSTVDAGRHWHYLRIEGDAGCSVENAPPNKHCRYWLRSVCRCDRRFLADLQARVGKIVCVCLVKTALAVVQPHTRDFAAEYVCQNDIEVGVVVEIDDRNLKCRVCRAEMKDLALGFGERQLQPVVVTGCSVTDAVRDRKIQFLVGIQSRDCGGPPERHSGRAQPELLLASFRGASYPWKKQVKRNDRDNNRL